MASSTLSSLALAGAIIIPNGQQQQQQKEQTTPQQQQNNNNSSSIMSNSTQNNGGGTNSTPLSINNHHQLHHNANMSSASFNLEEKIYKKEKQILLEFDMKTKDIKSQLNEGTKCLEQRLDTQINILYELQDFFKKRAEVEAQYSRDLDKMVKQITARHKSEKSKRETWHLHSAYKLWEALINDTKQHSKYHQTASEICSKYIADKYDDIIDDIKRIFAKCKAVGQSSHEEIFKVIGELHNAMKTYHEYQAESKQAEAKLKYVQSQKPKYEKQKSKKKLKQYEKQVEKRLQKYTETKVKAFKARNEYILSIDSANACVGKFCTEDIGDLVDCMDFGFHASLAKCIYMYLSAQDNIKRSRQMTCDNLSRSIGDLDSNADKLNYLEYFSPVFKIQKKFQFEPHKGDEVSQVNAQSLIRYEMEKRYEQLDNRLKTLKTENDEIFKTIEATEQSLLNFFDVKNCDMTDLFRDLNLTNQLQNGQTKDKRLEIEDYYVEKVRQYTISSNLIARLEARHSMMQKALAGCVNSAADKSFDKLSAMGLIDSNLGGLGSDHQQNKAKKKIGKAPIIGQPRLFGGKLIEYLNATKQDIPQIMTSCIKAINRLGLHNQGIFRIPGSQLEINQFKEAFEKGEDPLVTVNPREMNSVAGVFKLYLRELKDPLFPRDMYDTFLNCMRVIQQPNQQQQQQTPSNTLTTQRHNSSSTSSSGGGQLDAQTNGYNNNNDSSLPGSPPSPPTPPSMSGAVETLESLKVENIRKVMSTVPKQIYVIIRYLFSFLNHLSEFKDENMMDAYNIAICLAPTLIPVPEDKKDQVNHQTDTIELIKIIIQHTDEIFTMECDGPVYEKFDDGEMEDNNDDENMEESEEDEEDESDRFMRNLSDDESFVTEAIALYDYKGRSEKEISFKKGDWLAICGQLSADWWQGYLLNSNNITTIAPTATTKTGYIPDKYIALRSRRKPSNISNGNGNSGAGIIQSATTNTMLKAMMMNSSSPLVQAAQQDQHHHHSAVTNHHLCEFSKVKESDILNDEDSSISNDISTSSLLNNNKPQARSHRLKSHPTSAAAAAAAAAASANQSNRSIQSTNLSLNGSSLLNNHHHNQHMMKSSILQQQSPLATGSNKNSLLLSKRKSTGGGGGNISGGAVAHHLNNLNLNNKTQQQKIHQIEDALASVLDDMKQLDFTAGCNPSAAAKTTALSNKSNLIDKINNGCYFSSASSTSSTSSSTSSSAKVDEVTPAPHNHHLHLASFAAEDYLSSSAENSGAEDIRLKKQVIMMASNANNNKKRPDIVLDLPLNLLFSSPLLNNQQQQTIANTSTPSSNLISSPQQQQQHQRQQPQTKARRLSTDKQHQQSSHESNNLNYNTTPRALSNNINHSNKSGMKTNGHLLLTCAAAAGAAANAAVIGGGTNLQVNSSSQSTQALSENLPIRNFNVDFNINCGSGSGSNNLISSTTIDNNAMSSEENSPSPSSVASSSATAAAVAASARQHAAGKIVTLPMPHVPGSFMMMASSSSSSASSSSTSSASVHPSNNNPSQMMMNQQTSLDSNDNVFDNVDAKANTNHDDEVENDESTVDNDLLMSEESKPNHNQAISTLVASTIAKIEEDLKSTVDNIVNKQQQQQKQQSAQRKQPPPLMKKPEKSEEIMRKLGKSPPTSSDLQSTTSLAATADSSSCTSPISNSMTSSPSLNILSLQQQQQQQQAVSSSTVTISNVSIRLSNSKATDV